MPLLDEIQSAVQSVAVRVGPSVAGLGRGWGRGSGVVIAPGRILTNAHVLRGHEVAVTLGRGRAGGAAHGRRPGLDADLDIAVVEADTAGAEPVAWDPGAVDG